MNEEAVLKNNLLKLANFCTENLTDDWFIVIANNNSQDSTPKICAEMNKENKKINCLNLDKQGKGLAIQTSWQTLPADYYIFMDADLSTNLEALPSLINELKKNNDIVIGSRTLEGSLAKRSFTRRLVSSAFRLIIRSTLSLKLTDFACGFKGVNQRIVEKVLPQINNQEWFWDTELLYLASKQGYRIKEIPVQWTETPDKNRKQSLNILSVSLKYLKAILLVRRKSGS
ncbi:MAG: glycosyltransferase [Candidatus Magasanikbacteria bacterium]|nr:glycosyltransferase [Candidatus Magasanikbacteria bacterium]